MKSWKEEPCKFGTGEDGGVPELTESAMKQLGSQPSLPCAEVKTPTAGRVASVIFGQDLCKFQAESQQKGSEGERRRFLF